MSPHTGQPDRIAMWPDPVTNWLYVEARDVSHPEDREPCLVSFNHAKVSAQSEEGAYFAGRAAVQSANMVDTSGHAEGRFLNDYVVQV